jgi:tetratricopeptide (TPR) repeat protein
MRLKFAILIITTVGIVALFVIINSDKRGTFQKPEQLTLSLIKDKAFLKKVKSRSISEKENILTEASKILLKEIHTVTDNKHKDFILDDFNKVIPVIKFMLKIDPKNGHAIYFQGEIYRLMNDYANFTEYFQRYLETEEAIGPTLPKVTDPILCYDTPHGYCEQRTAWISQLLANYYYNEGIKAPNEKMKIKSFKLALEHIHNVRNHFPTGFVNSSVTVSTAELETNLNVSLSK